MRLRWLWATVLLLACHDTTNAAEGEAVVVGPGQHVIVGSVHIDVESQHRALVVVLHEGARHDQRHVTGHRVVKFGAHRVQFDEDDRLSRVTVVVTSYKPSSPLTSDDAVLAADEAMSPKSQGPVECKSATLSADGATFDVRCRDTDLQDSGRIVKVAATTGAIVSM